MLRSLACTGLVALGAAASAQQQLAPSRVQRITSTVRDAGVYHLATGTWTRNAQASLGADTIYDNTCSTGYFFALNDNTCIDEGRIPSPSGPSNLSAQPGCNTLYTIDGFQIAYCTDQPTMGAYTVNFYESNAPCGTLIGVTPSGSFVLTGLPASSSGASACWIVTIDLDSPPQTNSLAFDMLADGDGTFTGPSTQNLFGWSMRSSLGPLAANTGPVVAADFNSCTGYDGTRWDPVVNYSEAGTGMGTLNQYRFEGGSSPAGCNWFGGLPFASFHLEVYADACGPLTTGTPFCFGDGTGTACPCGNHSTVANNEGCLHALGTGGILTATGDASLSADTVVLRGAQMPSSPALYLQGTTRQGAGAGTVFGDGKHCAGGTMIRLETVTNSGGASQYPQAGDPSVSVRGSITIPGTRTYQVWFRNAAAFCTPATFNSTNGLEITWGA